jgi:iron complex outermembrane receptor protein
MYSKRIILFFLLFIPVVGFAQKCTDSTNGVVKDSVTGVPLSFVTVQIQEIGVGTVTDDKGVFAFDGLCNDSIHLVFSFIGYETKNIFSTTKKIPFLEIHLKEYVSILDAIVVKSKHQTTATQDFKTLNETRITQNANKNLSNLLSNIVGVGTLKNGSGIAKPVVHGLYGNRVSILNNGITQAGQQWGNDHSPEIDPLVANKITVIKGVGALEYFGANLGSVILVEPQKIKKNEKINGQAVYFFESNGFGNGLNLQLQQYRNSFGWKVNGTAKKVGDKKTGTYYLNNTGNEELNLAVQLEKKFSERFYTELYFSTFNTNLGILRGSHVGNLTDLEFAFTRKIPFFTEEKFSYQIDAPKQKVQHHLLKIHTKYFINSQKWVNFTIASQLNNRQEFDIRRSGRTETPALNLQQFSHFLEGKFQQEFTNNWSIKTGLQVNITDNTNNPETGILPLIPDYLLFENSAYLLWIYHSKKWDFEFGNRYNNVIQSVAAISQTLPRKIVRYYNVFHNYSSTVGLNYHLTDNWTMVYNLGFVTRNPAINELYSNGLHQGVSGIEVGNPNLISEKAIKTTLSMNGQLQQKIRFESLIYFQNIQNYILLIPQNEIRLTIRGAFPVFQYEQTNAQIFGADLVLNYEITTPLNLKLSYSVIKGTDIKNDIGLINIPANRINAEVTYAIPKWKQFENMTFSLANQYVFQQQNILPEQDFILPPNAYNLLDLGFAADLNLKKNKIHLFAKAENLLNTSYRDYLNRQRYFADDTGINLVFGIQFKF